MEKENVKDVASTEVVEEKKITLGELYGLSRSIYELSASSPSMKGKIVFALTKNEGKLESILKKTDKRQDKIMKKYVKLKKDGTYKLTEVSEEDIAKGERPEYIYKNEADKVKAATEVQNLMEEEAEIEFHKVWKNDFDALDIVPARNTRIGLFIKYLVSEEYDMQRLQ